ESVLSALVTSGTEGNVAGWITLAIIALGSLLTVAYSARFLWGGFWRKPGIEEVRPVRESAWFGVAPALLAVAGVVLGVATAGASTIMELYAGDFDSGGVEVHLAAFHGFDTAFIITAVTLVGGLGLFLALRPVTSLDSATPIGNI